ncbi:hypothetical protein [Plebeiibacterium marinum]|uniref:TonB-dependent receptor n=1 Tax=Plebeiibacterium marinum TaxID=2992111 RepID=A0AAE3MH93_9BACT|nr:hypothetical protein [Plebeiobacterium marinum]MCW3807739.1 hypothetical protein [Plebeiobacterium marinum]
MKKRISVYGFSLVFLGIFLMLSSKMIAQEKESTEVAKNDTVKVINTKEEKNRNVMLSAESATMPRQLNIGLPFQGDILIMENDLPVVYTFWTQMPTTAWRYDQSIGRIGLMSFQEGALTFGKVGYMVTSWDRQASRKFKGFASVYTSNYGTLRYDVNISGPIGKKGWGYTASIYENYEHGSGTNFKYTNFQERAEFFKVGLNKKYKNGELSVLYKHAEVTPYVMGGYSVLQYDGKGKTSEIEDFKIGKDSYILGSGLFPYFDYNTGEAKMGDLTSDEASQNLTDAFYLNGEHRFKNSMKLKYSAMYMKSKAALTIQYPLSISISEASESDVTEVYTLFGTQSDVNSSTSAYDYPGEQYNGAVQMVSSQYYPQVDINTFTARAELIKKVKNHDLRGGFTYQYYSAPIVFNSGVYYQTVEANPRLLNRTYAMDLSAYGMGTSYYPVTDATNGGIAVAGTYSDNTYSKTALYLSDDFTVGKRFNFGLGARIEHENNEVTRSIYPNEFVQDRLYTEKFKNKFNKVFIGNTVVKLTNNFGLLADATYNSWYNRYWEIDDATGAENIANDKDLIVTNFGGGIYWNHGKLFSLVSKITKIKKENNIAEETITSAAGESERVYPIFYDIETMGWSTDIISEPFKNFNMHLLFTIQDPRYKGYSYSTHFDNGEQSYNYSDNVIPDLSKILAEIDASYFLFKRDVRLWASLRYFGEQQANKINTIYYDGWWENFGGIDYNMSRNVTLKFQVVNFLDQRGVKGALVGGDQITDASSYVGRKLVASGIRPRTFELTATFKF